MVNNLTSQQEAFVRFRISGLTPENSARSAGFSRPAKAAKELMLNEDVQYAIAYGRDIAKRTAIQAGAIEFTKDDATALYLEAHAKSATSMEEIRAVDSLVKLHGLAAPEKKEIEITNRSQLEELSDEELLKMADKTYDLDPHDYMTVEDDPHE